MSRSRKKRSKVAAGAVDGPIVIHQAEPAPAQPGFARWDPPAKPSRLYHGNADDASPILSRITVPAIVKRATALDALRGFFLLSMTLGFTIQPEIFPTWMYHRQNPPPGHGFVDVAGISWRDVTYGAFLFSMAAAVPITLSLRIARGATEFSIIGAALRRGFMLLVFALLIGHSNTYFIGYTQTGRALAIVGFFLTFLIFTRPRKDWNVERFERVQRWGWVAVVAFLALSPLLYGETFSFSRVDGVIATLAFAAVTSWIIWYFTRNRTAARLIAIGVVAALFLAAGRAGPIQTFWFSSPLPWLWSNSSLVVLCIVLPGTIAGDLVLRWMQTPEIEATTATGGWSAMQKGALLLLALAASPILVVGMYNRMLPQTAFALAAVCAAGIVLSYRAQSPTERLVRGLFLWSTLWLMLGMALEPLGGGMRKVPDNLSYYFAVAGVSMLLLNAAVILIDLFRAERTVRLLTDVGQNPMLCYILYSVLINSVLEMIPATRGWLTGSQGEALLRSFIMLAVVALITRAFTRQRIFWRA